MNQIFIDARGASVARPMTADSSRLFRRAVPVLIGLLLVVRVIGMAVVPLMDTTEARYGETGRIMAELNDWITPWFDYGVPFWGKPPLAFWVTAASFKAFGVSEFTARLPHLAISLFIIGLAAWLAGRRDRDAALPTVALMTGSFLYFISAAVVMIDMELIFGTTLAMAGFWLAVEQPDSAKSSGRAAIHSRAFAGSLFFGGIILGLLAKGPVALVMTGIPMLCWTTYNRRWPDVWRGLPWLSGIALTLLLALPWYGIAEHRTPGFLEYFLVGEHWHRYITPGWTGDRYGNPHYFPTGTIWGFAVVGALPWSLLVPFVAWGWRKEIKAAAQAVMGKAAHRAVGSGVAANKTDSPAGEAGFIRPDERMWQGYLLIWALTPLLFFTLARNIMLPYVLPGLPAAAILAGGWLARQRRQGHQIDRWLVSGLVVTLLVICGVAMQNLSHPGKMEQKSVKTMLAAYDQARTQPKPLPAANAPGVELMPSDGPLIFIWARPFSARFYSHGQAIKVASNEEAWRRIGAGAAYVATPSGDAFVASVATRGKTAEPANEASAAAGVSPLPRRVARMGHYGDFDLLFVAAR